MTAGSCGTGFILVSVASTGAPDAELSALLVATDETAGRAFEKGTAYIVEPVTTTFDEGTGRLDALIPPSKAVMCPGDVSGLPLRLLALKHKRNVINAPMSAPTEPSTDPRTIPRVFVEE